MARWRDLARNRNALAALAIALYIPVLALLHRTAPPVPLPTAGELQAEAARGGYRMIDLGQLRERLEREPGRVLLVDTRQEWEYRTGHLPGAINYPLEPTWWARLTNRGGLSRALGPDKTRPLVFY